jgi:hypothetical protein
MATTYTPGHYIAEITAQGFEESSVKGTPAFYLQIRVLSRYDAENTPQACPQFERTIWHYITSETRVVVLRAQLRGIGLEVESLVELDPATPGHASLVGRRITVDCELEDYQGRPQERWRIPQPRKTLDLAAVRALDERFSRPPRDAGGQAKPPAPPTTSDGDNATA